MKISNSTLKFMKNYHKQNYQKEQDIKGDEYDINERQAPLRIFNRVNEKKKTYYKYKFFAHKRKIYSFLSKKDAERMEELVLDINDYEMAKTA